MDCQEFLDRYSEYDDSLLPISAMEDFRRHLEDCPSCRRYDLVLRKGRMMARQISVTPSEDFLPALDQRLQAEAATRSGRATPAWWARRKRAGRTGGLLALAAATLAIWMAGPPKVAGAPGGAGPSAAGGQQAPLHFHRADPSGHAGGLPLRTYADPRDWTISRVDHRDASSYSPLVIGPPAYRAERASFVSPSPPIPITLD